MKALQSRALRKVLAVWVLSLAMVLGLPTDSAAHSCPDGHCDRYFACMDDCDFENFGCVWYCSGYPEPYYSECTDACWDHYTSCWDYCGSSCFYFCP